MKEKEDKYISSLLSFIPKNVVKYRILSKKEDMFTGIFLFADISGFTAMSENLSKLGKEGAEEVNRIINNFFSPLINIVYKYSGDIVYFAGDAFLAYFKGEDESNKKNAISAAEEILTFAKENSQINTKLGVFNIKIHMGLNKGKAFFIDLKNAYIFCGKTLNKLMKIIDLAGANQIVKGDSLNIPQNFAGYGVKMEKSLDKREDSTINFVSKNIFDSIKELVPEWILKRITTKPYFDYKDGEHRKLTFLFLHISGLNYSRQKDRILLNKFYDVLKEIVNNYDGWISRLDVYKDSERIFVIFGYPFSYENLEKRAMFFINEIMNNPKLKHMKIKAGINCGYVFIAPIGNEIRREYTIIGDAVNLCARIASSAEDGAIFVSEDIYNKTYDLFNYKFVGEKEYKGKKEKIRIYKLLSKKEFKQKGLETWIGQSEKIIGREKEIKKIREIIELVSSSNGQILQIIGEAGIGKTRLVEELIKITREKDFYVLVGNCSSFGSFSYLPFTDILNDIFKISPLDSIEVKKKKIIEKIELIDKEMKEWLPLIGELIGLKFEETKLTKYIDPKTRKQKINELILKIIRFISNTKPVNLIIEDAHWIDSNSLETINYISRNIENDKILLTLSYRPIEKEEEFMNKKYSNRLLLKELSEEEVIELIYNLLHIKDMPEDYKKIVLEKSQKNPFYVEELVKSFIEQGIIIEKEYGWSFQTDIKEINIPDTLESLILSRVDRLDFKDKNLLQIASVIGVEFEEFLFHAVIENEKEMNKSLENLQRLDLLRKTKEDNLTRYHFKHILTREVVYNTISFAKREELHRKIACYIEKEMEGRLEEYLELLSYHFYMGQNYEKSLMYSVQLGEKVKKIYALEEGYLLFKRAIESYEKLQNEVIKEEKKDIYVKALEGIGDIEYILGKYDYSLERYKKILSLPSVETNIKNEAIFNIAVIFGIGKSEFDKAKEILNDLLKRLDIRNEKKLYMRIKNLLGIIERRKSNYEESKKYYNEALQVAEEINDIHYQGSILSNLAHVAYNKGEYDEAIEIFTKAMEHLQKDDNLLSLGITYNNMGLAYQGKKEFDKALEYYKLSLNIIKKIGDRKIYGNILSNCGAIYQEKKDYKTALDYYNSSLKIAEEFNDIQQIGIGYSLIGKLYLELNEIEKSLDNMSKALIYFNKIGDKRLAGLTYKALGEIYIKLNKFEEAFNYLNKSKDIFEMIKNNVELENVIQMIKSIEDKVKK